MKPYREIIKVAKANHKQSLKNKVVYIKKRDVLVSQILNSKTPDWGGVKISLINW